MCNLYSITRSQEAKRRLFRIKRDLTGNFPGLPAIYPDTMASVVRTASDGERDFAAKPRRRSSTSATLSRPTGAACLNLKGAAALSVSRSSRAGETETPIEHVVIIIGENRSFDHLFATYPPRPGEYVWNLLSKGIITAEESS